MIIKDMLDLVNKEKRKKERAKVAQKFAAGIGVAAAAGVATGILFAEKPGKETRADLKNKAVSTVETIKDTVQKKVYTVKDTMTHAAQEVSNIIIDLHGKTEDVLKDIKDDCHETTQDKSENSVT